MTKKRIKKKKSSNKTAMRIIIAFILILGAIASYAVYEGYSIAFKSNAITQTNKDYLYISTGSDINQVAEQLSSSGWIDSKENFLLLADIKKYNTNVKAGRYKIKSGWSNNDIINHLRLEGNQVPVKLTFNNLPTIEEFAEKVSPYLEFEKVEFMEALENNASVKALDLDKATYISLFIPNTYEFFWNTSADAFLERMVYEYQKFWDLSLIHISEPTRPY